MRLGVGSGGGGVSGGGGGGGRSGKSTRGAGLGYDDLGKDWQHSLVLATGSVDGSIHIFDISKGQVGGERGEERWVGGGALSS